jgi:catechol 2,3-dioxygenase
MDDDPFVINSSMNINHVHLNVTDLSKSLDFYKSILGFRILKEDLQTNTVYLAPDPFNKEKMETLNPRSSLIVLTEIKDSYNPKHLDKSKKKKAGLYHFAILLPERGYLASFLRNINDKLDKQYYEGMADHGVSESIYIHDPDHIGIEIYRDRSPSEWVWNNNEIHMVTEPLDVADLLTSHKAKTWRGMPAGTKIGHVHLHVSDLNRARNFYSGVIGLFHTASYPGAHFFAADRYHHHIGTNTWLGTDILSADSSEQHGPGLDHYAIELPNNDEKETTELRNNLANHGVVIDDNIVDVDQLAYDSTFYIHDPDGIKIQFLFY